MGEKQVSNPNMYSNSGDGFYINEETIQKTYSSQLRQEIYFDLALTQSRSKLVTMFTEGSFGQA